MENKIKIKLEFTVLLSIDADKNGSIIEIDIDTISTIEQLLKHLGIKKEHFSYIIPFANQKVVKRSYNLKDKDEIFLFLTVGGG